MSGMLMAKMKAIVGHVGCHDEPAEVSASSGR